MVIYPLGHGQITKNGKIIFFFILGPRHLFLNFQIFLDMFWKAFDLGYRINNIYHISFRVYLGKNQSKEKKNFQIFFFKSRLFIFFIEIFLDKPRNFTQKPKKNKYLTQTQKKTNIKPQETIVWISSINKFIYKSKVTGLEMFGTILGFDTWSDYLRNFFKWLWFKNSKNYFFNK